MAADDHLAVFFDQDGGGGGWSVDEQAEGLADALHDLAGGHAGIEGAGEGQEDFEGFFAMGEFFVGAAEFFALSFEFFGLGLKLFVLSGDFFFTGGQIGVGGFELGVAMFEPFAGNDPDIDDDADEEKVEQDHEAFEGIVLLDGEMDREGFFREEEEEFDDAEQREGSDGGP